MSLLLISASSHFHWLGQARIGSHTGARLSRCCHHHGGILHCIFLILLTRAGAHEGSVGWVLFHRALKTGIMALSVDLACATRAKGGAPGPNVESVTLHICLYPSGFFAAFDPLVFSSGIFLRTGAMDRHPPKKSPS